MTCSSSRLIRRSCQDHLSLEAVSQLACPSQFGIPIIRWGHLGEGTSSITNTAERALRRLSQPILALILVRRLYAFANVPCNPGAGSLSKFGSVCHQYFIFWGENFSSSNLRHIKDLTLCHFLWNRKMHFCRIRNLMIIFLMESKHRTRIQRQQCLPSASTLHLRVWYIFEIVDGDVRFSEDGPSGVFRWIGVDGGFG
jgi:hypothetical protein